MSAQSAAVRDTLSGDGGLDRIERRVDLADALSGVSAGSTLTGDEYGDTSRWRHGSSIFDSPSMFNAPPVME